MAHLLVTGGAGYIGSHTLRALRAAGHTAAVVDDLRAGRREFVGDAPFARADVGDRAALARVFAELGPFDGVLHFAASISVPESVSRPIDYYGNNTSASLVLLERCLEAGVRAFVLSSTAAVYGSPDAVPIREDAPIRPINPYGASKAMFERMLEDASRASSLRSCALRYFNACGADPAGDIGDCHLPVSHLIPAVLEAAMGLRPALDLYGTDYPTEDGTCVRDYIHVMDLADAHVRALDGLLGDGADGAFNLGIGRGISNREVISAVERVLGRPVPVREAARRPGDPDVLVADASRFREAYGWVPRYSDLETIIQTAWGWIETRSAGDRRAGSG